MLHKPCERCGGTNQKMKHRQGLKIAVEFTLVDRLRPDVLILENEEPRLAFEILVHHRVDSSKADRLRVQNLHWVELQAEDVLADPFHLCPVSSSRKFCPPCSAAVARETDAAKRRAERRKARTMANRNRVEAELSGTNAARNEEVIDAFKNAAYRQRVLRFFSELGPPQTVVGFGLGAITCPQCNEDCPVWTWTHGPNCACNPPSRPPGMVWRAYPPWNAPMELPSLAPSCFHCGMSLSSQVRGLEVFVANPSEEDGLSKTPTTRPGLGACRLSFDGGWPDDGVPF